MLQEKAWQKLQQRELSLVTVSQLQGPQQRRRLPLMLLLLPQLLPLDQELYPRMLQGRQHQQSAAGTAVTKACPLHRPADNG